VGRCFRFFLGARACVCVCVCGWVVGGGGGGVEGSGVVCRCAFGLGVCVFWVVVWLCLCRDANNLRVAVIVCGVLCCLRGACVFVLLAWLWLVWRAPLRGSCGLSFASLLAMQEFSFWFLIRASGASVTMCVRVWLCCSWWCGWRLRCFLGCCSSILAVYVVGSLAALRKECRRCACVLVVGVDGGCRCCWISCAVGFGSSSLYVLLVDVEARSLCKAGFVTVCIISCRC
jgi:hypothetical protein